MERMKVVFVAVAMVACGVFLAGCPKSMKTMQVEDPSPKTYAYVR